MVRYKAKWIYGSQCLRKGKIFAECEANSLPDFAKQLCTTYAYNLGDGFWFARYESEAQIKDCYGSESDDLPDWFEAVKNYPVLLFGSNFGEEILCKPSASAIINQIRNEGYGDYDLTITGI